MSGRFLNFALVLEKYYDFSSSVACFQIADGLGGLAQAVAAVDDRGYFSDLHEVAHDGQVVFAGFCKEERDQLPTDET